MASTAFGKETGAWAARRDAALARGDGLDYSRSRGRGGDCGVAPMEVSDDDGGGGSSDGDVDDDEGPGASSSSSTSSTESTPSPTCSPGDPEPREQQVREGAYLGAVARGWLGHLALNLARVCVLSMPNPSPFTPLV